MADEDFIRAFQAGSSATTPLVKEQLVVPGNMPVRGTDRRAFEARDGKATFYAVLRPEIQPHKRARYRSNNAGPGRELINETGTYNCAGLVLVNRRGWIGGDSAEPNPFDAGTGMDDRFTDVVLRILAADGFHRRPAGTAPRIGDIVVYRKRPEIPRVGLAEMVTPADRDEVVHLGVVVSPNLAGATFKVLSKWGTGGEYVHDEKDVPFDLGEPASYWAREVEA